MIEASVSIVGLPGSGKTTFLAALWHLLTERDIDTELRLKDLHAGNNAYLMDISSRWREALIQERTRQTGNQNVQINLVDKLGSRNVRVNFPDVAGEAFADMWENRTCVAELVEMLRCNNVLLFINADTVQVPRWVVDEVEQTVQMGLSPIAGEEQMWEPQIAPTQVQVVELLQLLMEDPFNVGPRNLNVILSAWDQVEAEGMDPNEYVEQRLPLLGQYLQNAHASWNTTISGVSAQGGIYGDPENSQSPDKDAERLRKMDDPSQRIRLVIGKNETKDLTLTFSELLD